MPSVKVSIVMPSLNVAKYIRQCIESVLAQSLKEIEIICINDGSKDKSEEILRGFAQNNPYVKVVNFVRN